MPRPRPDPDFDMAFPVLYRRAVQVGSRMLRDQAGGEDVAAEALARAYSRWPAIRDLPHREAWVLRVVANLALDVMRRHRRPVQRRLSEEESDQVVERVALVQALAGLPRRQREVVVLRYLVDLSEQDVAAVLGMAAGTVKAHSHRGLATLRRQLGTDIEEATDAII